MNMKTTKTRIIGVVVVVLIALALTLVIQHQIRAQKEEAERQQDEQERSQARARQAQRIQVPLTRQRIVFNPAGLAQGRQNMFLNEKGEPAASDNIVVNIKGSANKFAIARFSVVGDPQNLIRLLTEKNDRLFDIVVAVFGAKSLEEIETVGFKKVLKSELQTQINQVPGGECVKEVIITAFIVQ